MGPLILSKLHCLEADFTFAHGKQGDSVDGNTKKGIVVLTAGTFVFAMGGVDTPDAPAAANGTVHFGQMFLSSALMRLPASGQFEFP